MRGFSALAGRVQVRGVWTIGVGILLAYVLGWSAWRTTHGFIAYYAASRLLVEGRLGPAVYDDGWFGSYIQDLTGTGVLEIFGPNPPTMALMAVPVAWLDPATARLVWLLVSLAAASAVAAALAAERIRAGMPWPAVVTAIILLNPAMFANLRMGQAYLFVFALLGVAALLLLRHRDRAAGVLLGLALALKSAGLPLLVVLLWMRRWTVAAAATVTAALAVAFTAAVAGAEIWWRYPEAVAEFVARPASSVTAYQTTLGLFRRLCVADPQWNPYPAASCEALAVAAPMALVGAAWLATALLARRSSDRLWIAAGLCLCELSLPIAAEPHFMLFAAALALVPIGGAALAVFAGLYVVPLAFTAEVFTEGWRVLAAYPRLYAAWLLWALAVAAMLRCRAAAEPGARRSAGTVDRVTTRGG